MKVLAFFAHPDDETMLTGGTLALLAKQGVEVHYLCATRGEGGERGEPAMCSQAELGKVREREMACAVQTLGGASLTFLGYEDPVIGPDNHLFAYSIDLPLIAGQVAAAARRMGADAILTHGSNGEYGHPAHQVSNQAARLALEDFGPDRVPLLYTAAASFPDHPQPFLVNADDPAHLILDVSPVLSQKTHAAMCHRTQHALFVRRRSEEAGRKLELPEVISHLESLHRAAPATDGFPDDWLAERLKSWVMQTG